jgi:methionine--tRNA ligase beta chain
VIIIKNQNFGVEIEMTGITRSTAAKVIAGYFNTTATHIGGCYDSYSVRDNDNRQWKIMRDASLRCTNRSGEQASALYSVEFVTPICNYNDIETIQELVRKLRGAGARVNSSCGMHCHIDASTHTPKTLRNIVNIMASKEDLLYKSLKVNVSREHYCQKMDTRFLDEINNRPPLSMEQLKSMWYDGGDYSYRHYDDSRYHGLNLHSVFSKGTIEFRLFNSTLHAGEVKSAIQLCLAISHQALIQKSARHTKTVSDNEKYTFRTWLLRLGLIGDEFKTARHHLLKNLDGNIAWKDPAQAEKQKENAKQEAAAKPEIEGLAQIQFDDFAKVELRVAKIEQCEPIKKAKKLLKLQVNDGSGELRQIVSGIAPWYKPENLIGKSVIIVANLKPAKLCGEMSNGMLLAGDVSENDVKVLFVDGMPAGTKIR